jgi:hypothetical protein
MGNIFHIDTFLTWRTLSGASPFHLSVLKEAPPIEQTEPVGGLRLRIKISITVAKTGPGFKAETG